MTEKNPLRRAALAAGLLAVTALVAVLGGLSAASDSTAAASQYEPRNTAEPTISGTAREGERLTATTGTWESSTPITYSFQWLRCDTNGAACVAIAGATAQTYTLVAADVGKRVRVRVTATNSSGSASRDSNATNVVQSSAASREIKLADGRVSVPAADVAPPQRLVIETLNAGQAVIRSRAPFTLRVRVADTQGRVVRNALVYVIGLPYRRILQPAEVQTAEDGWATITIQPTTLLPLRNGATLVFFVRARKAGDNVLAGVSTRRLMQIRLGAPA